MSRKANLVAVQARMERADYRDAAAFQRKIASLMDSASKQADFSLPTLVSFPELIGMYLSFLPHYWDEMAGESTLQAAAAKVVGKRLADLPEDCRQPRLASRKLLFIDTALDAERIYRETFSSLARKHRVYVAAGSIAAPPVESEPSKGGRHVIDATRVYNTAYLFSPTGACLAQTPKVDMTGGLEQLLFDPGDRRDVLPVETALGRVGTLVCFDGFHETLVERMDGLGVQILLKPSYNMHSWDGPSTYDASSKEGEAWLRAGCPAIIQGRENVRYGVNAMLVGAVFEDTAAEGLSSIAANTGRPGATWRDGMLAIASQPDAEEVLAATVELGQAG